MCLFLPLSKASHEVAVKKICWYLKGTMHQGIIYTPTSTFSVDCYCDSDFVGLFGHEQSHDPICAKSCTGYVITLSGCPLQWVSKLQTTIALSTMEAEYQALSSSCCDLIPPCQMIEVASKALHVSQDSSVTSYSTIYEDKSSCLFQANLPKMTPCTKHIAVVYHWFCEFVVSGILCILQVTLLKTWLIFLQRGLSLKNLQLFANSSVGGDCSAERESYT